MLLFLNKVKTPKKEQIIVIKIIIMDFGTLSSFGIKELTFREEFEPDCFNVL